MFHAILDNIMTNESLLMSNSNKVQGDCHDFSRSVG